MKLSFICFILNVFGLIPFSYCQMKNRFYVSKLIHLYCFIVGILVGLITITWQWDTIRNTYRNCDIGVPAVSIILNSIMTLIRSFGIQIFVLLISHNLIKSFNKCLDFEDYFKEHCKLSHFENCKFQHSLRIRLMLSLGQFVLLFATKVKSHRFERFLYEKAVFGISSTKVAVIRAVFRLTLGYIVTTSYCCYLIIFIKFYRHVNGNLKKLLKKLQRNFIESNSFQTICNNCNGSDRIDYLNGLLQNMIEMITNLLKFYEIPMRLQFAHVFVMILSTVC